MHPENNEKFGWLVISTELGARRLLGCELARELDDDVLRVRIVETEAYDQDDEASHAYRGPTSRNATMFGPAGHLYVYTIHGHHCCNVVTGQASYGQGALIRAVEPLAGEAVLRRRRGGRFGYELTNGPGKLCQALGVTRALDGHDLDRPPLQLIQQAPLANKDVVTSTRIGISKAVETPRRFYVRHSPYVSAR